MAAKKHPFDVVAEQLEAAGDQPVAEQEPSPDFWELRSATDENVGDYPQTEPCEPDEMLAWGQPEGLAADGFLAVAVPEQRLRPAARWTNVLKAGLPAAWSQGHLFD